MDELNIERIWKSQVGPYTVLKAKVNGKVAIWGPFEKFPFLGKYEVLYLGPGFEDVTQVIIPAEPENGIPENWVLRGFTDDPRLVSAYKRWMEAE